ncbi:GAF domain-containing protein [Streptomyces sp. NPDC058985]|uniref:GAF domain-containing protein n=1 Tax=Streptomyces sp. NPDC058985 TaxID=3346684 RepID=UPI003697BA3C
MVPDFVDVAGAELAEAVSAGDEPPKTFGGGDLHLRRAAVRSASGLGRPGLLRPGEPVPAFPDRPMARELQEGWTVLTDRQTLGRALADPALLRLAAPEGGDSMLAAPLFVRGLVLGLVAAWRTERPEPFDEEDAALLAEIAARSAFGVDNARRYAREHRGGSDPAEASIAPGRHLHPGHRDRGCLPSRLVRGRNRRRLVDAIELPSLRTGPRRRGRSWPRAAPTTRGPRLSRTSAISRSVARLEKASERVGAVRQGCPGFMRMPTPRRALIG